MTKKMLIDAAHPEEIRVSVLDQNRVEDFDFESAARKPLRGNIYLARVTRVEPSLQAAFVEYGGNRHGFLAFSEIHPDYYQIPVADRERLQAAEAEVADLAAKLELSQRGDEDDEDGVGLRDSDDRNGPDEDAIDEDDDALAADADAADEADDEAGEALASPDAGDNDASNDRKVEEEEEEEEEDVKKTVADNDDQGADEATGDTPEEDDSHEAADDAREDAGPTDLAGAEQPAADFDPDTEASDDSSDADDPSDEDDAPTLHAEDESDDADDAADDEIDIDEDDSEDDAPVEQDAATSKKAAAERNALFERYKDAKRRRSQLLRNYKIQEVIKRRQILLVQVVKEERGNKGAALTTYMSLAGRYCVLMPNTARGGGISRKIANNPDRRRLRRVVDSLEVPQGMGLIIRTAGAKRTKTEIKRDYDYLLRLWENIRTLTLKSIAPCLIYEEASLIKRAIRDLYDKDISKVLVEGEAGYREAKDFMKMLMPSHAKHVQPYKERAPIFLKYGVETQLDGMYQPSVRLKSGGYIVIHQTEALVAIDVNSGRATRERNIELTALKTNIEAAQEAARQFRLRDLAGLIVIDFIDMEEPKNNRKVEKALKDALKSDRARIQTGRISTFGLLEMSRQRRRSGIVDGTTQPCPTCAGAGVVRSHEMAALRILRAIEGEAISGKVGKIAVRASIDGSLYLLNHHRDWLKRIEVDNGVSVEIIADAGKAGDAYDLEKSGAPRPRTDEAVVVRADQQEMIEAEDDDVVERVDAAEEETGEEKDSGRKRRRRRRRKKDAPAGEREDSAAADDAGDDAPAEEERAAREDDEQDADKQPKRRRRRGRRGGRRNRQAADRERDAETQETTAEAPAGIEADEAAPSDTPDPAPDTAADAENASGEETEPPTVAAQPERPESNDEPADAPAFPNGADHDDAEHAVSLLESEQPEEEPQDDPALAAPETAPTAEDEAEAPEAAAPKPKKPARKGWWQRASGA